MVACVPEMKVYGLIDPETGLLRYVGQTTESIEERFSRHIYTAVYGKKTHCYDWVRSLLKRNLKPVVWIIQEGLRNKKELDFAERGWIKYFREVQGVPLTNHTGGGEGGSPDERTRRKISESKVGIKHSQESRRKKSVRYCGEGNPFYGKKHSENTCRRISEANKGGINQNTFKTHCKWGHEFTPENTYIRPRGKGRGCRECHRTKNREAMRRYYKRKKKEREFLSEGSKS